MRFATRPDGKAREVVGVAQQVMDLFSSRRRAITKRTTELMTAFETKFGRVPNSLELDRLQRQATFATRNAKSHQGETNEARLERWDRELRAEVATGLAGVADTVLDIAGKAPEPDHWSPEQVIETALAAVQETKAAWTAPDLTRAISDALPDRLGDLSGEQVSDLLDGLTAQALESAVPLDAARPGEDALPTDLRLNNGSSAYNAPGGQLYATATHVHTERTLVAATRRGGAPALTAPGVTGFLNGLATQGIELGADQAAAVRGVLRSGAAVESLVGPAGTGKSFVVGTLAKAWTDPALWDGARHRVVGLATSQIATEVLAGEGLDARNIASWLGAQRRLRMGNASGQDQEWELRPGDLVVVDESAMADTPALAEIHRYAAETGAKLLLVGDHRQLAAVGAGGAMELMADAGSSYELADARRFTARWERQASLRLREGDPSVIAEYHRHGRVLDGGRPEDAEAAACRAWLADTLQGRRSLLIVDTNEQAARMSARLRAELVRLGRVAEHGVPLGLQGTFAGVGDMIQARRNGWSLVGYDGNRRPPINREQYRVLEARADGSLVVATREGERISLPAAYVAQHVALAYASTTHAAQGVTVDTSHALVTANTGHEALYVAMTRGRHDNVAHVVTITAAEDAPDSAKNLRRSPAAVLDNVMANAAIEQSALATAVESSTEMNTVRTPRNCWPTPSSWPPPGA
ncbi:AAA family ATPase [Actinokineospora soli]|uniref:AAA family ATPase n=1 Tax=Actinokineospora soli TaxID=1048753 RepID=A0ABW2TFX0_9PSEU